MNKNTNIDRKELSKEIQEKYRKMQDLFGDNSTDESIFTDKFLEIYQEVQNKVLLLLSSSEKLGKQKLIENTERLFQNSFNKAILSIININTKNIKDLGYTIFKTKEIQRISGKSNGNIEFREGEKYEDFLRVYSELFFGRKDVEIKTYKESLNDKKMRKSPYHIINIKGKDFSKTILISNQIGEATYVYDSLIEPKQFEGIEKGEDINGSKPIKVVYRDDYKDRLKSILSGNNDLSILDENLSQEELAIIEQEFFYENYLKTIFTSITDKDGNELKVDLKFVGLRDFSKNLYFGYGTKYTNVHGKTLLRNNGGENNFGLKKVLEKGGIPRNDLASEKIDYKKNKHIKKVFEVVTDRNGNDIVVDFKNINLSQFRDLYFGYGTKYGMITGRSLLINNGGHNNKALRKVLKLGGITREDLPYIDINYNKNEHIKEVLSVITDEYGNILDIDLKNILMIDFGKLYFGYGTRYGIVNGKTLLKNNGGENNTAFKKVLEMGGIR